MRQGEAAERVILLDRGLVKVTTESATGYTSLLALRGAGELLGELSCVDGGPRSATASAMGAVSGVSVPARTFTGLLEVHPGLALAVLRCVALRLRESDIERGDLGALPVGTRTAVVLARLSRRYGETLGSPECATARRLSITQHELAGAVGASRESVVRALSDLVGDGLIRVGRGRVVVSDPTVLAEWRSGAVGSGGGSEP
ncbi:cAMP-activated global transcriptional regulator CRP [Kitasatospora terrestris]|uniref:cAMP-activated global transcriptional regulator CRP n=2 Tax=Kitasatospora terrestris TaxID=258051 RepID=A0ABP9DNS6_9ACTN